MTGDEKVKKSRDPIFTTCFVIFMVAVVAILGVYVHDHYLEKDNTEIAYGDKVDVNYTGSFYGYVGDEKAVVFDTSYSSVGNDDSIIKANSFTKSSYKVFTVTVGNGSALAMFEEALIGHKVGDKIKVEIPVGEGYVGADNGGKMSMKGMTMASSQVMSEDAFEDLYEDVKLSKNGATYFKSVYGWDAYATLSNSQVVVNYVPAAGETYEYADNEDSKFGKISYKVTSVGKDIVYDMSITDTVSTGGADGEIQMLEMNLDGKTVYVTNVNGSEFTYKTCDEKSNMTLYFEIEIEKIY